jgi:hypothetical protein
MDIKTLRKIEEQARPEFTSRCTGWLMSAAENNSAITAEFLNRLTSRNATLAEIITASTLHDDIATEVIACAQFCPTYFTL